MLRYIAHARGARPVAHALDDPARLVHDEAERDGRDDPGHRGRNSAHPSVRAASRRRRATQSCSSELEAMLAEITGFPGDLAAAERRLAGRVRGPARHPRVPRDARRGAPQRLPDPAVAHGTNPASAVMAGMKVVVVTPRRERQHRRRRPRGARPRSTRDRPRRADGHVPVDARRVRGGRSSASARSSTSTAARSTWTART